MVVYNLEWLKDTGGIVVTKPITKRQKQAIDTKNKIYNVSIALFEKYGYDNVHIKDIVKEANISVGTFYHYYKSKEDVFYEIYVRADHYFDTTVREGLKEEYSIDRVVEFFDYYAAKNMETDIDTLRQMLSINNKNYIKKGRAMQSVLIDVINEGQNRGEIIDIETPEELCEKLFIIARGIVFDWGLHDGDYNLRDKMKHFIGEFIKVFLKK